MDSERVAVVLDCLVGDMPDFKAASYIPRTSLAQGICTESRERDQANDSPVRPLP